MEFDFSRYDSLPFSVIIAKSDSKVAYKNNYAQFEFQGLRKGSSLKKYSELTEDGEFIKEKMLFGKLYFVAASKMESGAETFTKYIIIDEFFNSSTRFSAILTESGKELISKVERLCSGHTENSSSELFEKSFAKKLAKCKNDEITYLRFLKLCEKKAEKSFSCGLFDLFCSMKKKFCDVGIEINFDIPKFSAIVFNIYDISFIIVNIIRFITLYTGAKSITVCANEVKNICELKISFCDNAGIIRTFGEIFTGEDENFDDIMTFIPLYSAFTVMKKYKRNIAVTCENENASLILELKKSNSLPESALSNSTDSVLRIIDGMVNEIFY